MHVLIPLLIHSLTVASSTVSIISELLIPLSIDDEEVPVVKIDDVVIKGAKVWYSCYKTYNDLAFIYYRILHLLRTCFHIFFPGKTQKGAINVLQ